MNEYLRCCRDCKVGIKAFQNIHASVLGIERISSLGKSNDHLLLSSLFYMSIIRYAKAFLKTKTDNGSIAYPIKHLGKAKGFSKVLHSQLLSIRNTLVAHDDFDQIEPRILMFGLCPEGTTNIVPTSLVISNKCISHLDVSDGLKVIENHIKAARLGISQKLFEDIGKLRNATIQYPDQAKDSQKYSKNYGKVHIPSKGETKLIPPEFMNDKWLDLKEPDFSVVNNGFRYE